MIALYQLKYESSTGRKEDNIIPYYMYKKDDSLYIGAVSHFSYCFGIVNTKKVNFDFRY